VPLPEGGMSVTVERIQTPKNTAVEAIGIAPDVAVTLTVADMERGQDTQLQAALHALHAAWEWLRHAA
jgi:C-terminal processing protease CtpA/Prc